MDYLVIEIFNNLYNVFDIKAQQTYSARLAGKLRKDKAPKVGDIVQGDLSTSDNEIVIQSISARKNEFVRPNVANISHALVLMSTKEPKFEPNIVTKLLMQFDLQNIKPIILITKNDLGLSTDIRKSCRIWKKVAYEVHIFSNNNPYSWPRLKRYLTKGIYVVTGKSGVGKTSLLNNLLKEENLRVDIVSNKSKQGKHTTRNSRLLMIDKDLWVIDTPGFSSLNLQTISEEELYKGFVIFKANANKCKFRNCSHTNEPDCYIKELVQKKKIPQAFYDEYLSILEEYRNQKTY